jgi:hypothetical protein
LDLVIAFVLVAVLVASAAIVGLIPLFGPGKTPPDKNKEPRAALRDKLERRMREVPDE